MAKKKASKRKPAARAPRARNVDPAAGHTYGDGAHTIGNVVIHGLAHYNDTRKHELGAWLRKLADSIETEQMGETFAARYNVRNL